MSFERCLFSLIDIEGLLSVNKYESNEGGCKFVVEEFSQA